MINLEKKKYVIIFIIGIFVLACAIRIYPSLHRGHFYAATSNLLGVSKNLAISGDFSTDDKKGVVLAPSLVSEKGVRSRVGNDLTVIIYGEIFKQVAFYPELPFYSSIVLFALVDVLLFLLVLRLFNAKLALLVSGLHIFMPFVSQGANKSGYYEFALIFLFIGLLLYLDKKQAVSKTRLALAGLFFGLAAVSRNALFISFIPLVIYDFYKRRSFQRFFSLIVPFMIVVGIFFAPVCFNGGSEYLHLVSSASFEKKEFDGHLFPDPYTFHYERDEYLETVKIIDEPDNESVLSQYGIKTPLKYKLYSYYFSLKFYIVRCFRLINFGGPFLLLLMVLGGLVLYQRRKDLAKLFILWLGIWYIILSLLKTNNWDHFLEISFPLVLLAGVGLYWIIVKVYINIKNKSLKYSLIAFFLLAVIVHLFYCNKWLFHDLYRNSFMEKIPLLSQVVDKEGLTDRDIVAIDYEYLGAYYLNYYTGKSFIYFDKETIKKLLKNQKLKEAFDFYGVTVMLSSDKGQLDEIKRRTGVKVIYVFLD